MSFTLTIWAEHRQTQYDIITQAKHILHYMQDSIRENTDKQALQQPPEGVETEQQLHQHSRQLWDYKQHWYQTYVNINEQSMNKNQTKCLVAHLDRQCLVHLTKILQSPSAMMAVTDIEIWS